MTIACRIHGARDLRLEQENAPELGPHDVELRLGAGGKADAAREAMSTHLARSHDRFTASWTADAGAAPRTPRRTGARKTA